MFNCFSNVLFILMLSLHVHCSLSENLKTPERRDKYFSKVVEDFIGRARKLESELLRYPHFLYRELFSSKI